MLIKKATDIPRDSWWIYKNIEVRVLAITEGFIVFRPDNINPCALQWETFMETFEPLHKSEWPKKLCLCGCGFEISEFDSRRKMFKSDNHKGKYYRRLKREKNTM